ncbi:MAG: hypothetical protein RR996_02230 [Alistipes sp.]
MKKLNLFKLLFAAMFVTAAMAFTGCSDDDDKTTGETITLDVTPAALAFDANGGAKTFTIATNGAWKITGAEGAKWLTVAPALTGSGNQTITVTVAKGAEAHNVNLKVAAFATGTETEVVSKTVAISQTAVETITLDVTPAALAFDANGGTKTFAITTKGTWKITGAEGAAWLTVAPALTGSGDQTITVTAVKGTEARNVNLKVAAFATGTETEAASKTVAISQAAASAEGDVTPIANITAGVTCTAEGVVVATTTRSFLIKDNTGAILVYVGKDHTNVVGDKVRVAGLTSEYGGLIQFGAEATTTKLGMEAVTQPTPTVMDGAAMDAYAKAVKISYIQYTGVLTIKGTYYNIAVDGATIKGSLSNASIYVVPAAYNGAKVVVTGYAIGTAAKGAFLTTAVTDVKLAEDRDPSDTTFDDLTEDTTTTWN